ncbi:MAG: transglutaminase domain-containing protein, partial [Bacteroidales bacterium]|nr:transglutaminase domain-containing protein [Bacteroidales bacterium]
MKYRILTIVVALLVFAGCNRDPHFITNKQYRNQVHADFLQRQQLAQGRADALFGGMDTLSNRYREALEFLYAYMPYSDLADYDYPFFLDQVRTAFAARDTFSWGKEVPEDIFRHFVLVYRVNNENLDTARQFMFRQLKDRVKDLPMDKAALEVNHWCHEHVAYRAADARTSAPLATMRTSLGRCGEESTFAVTALRAVGIPARQCYTPRWAHCDDNHAWVEVWVANPDGKGGEWKFLGACEPDPELNMGWFAIPSTRCLMVHSKAFGRYHGDEEVVKQTALYSELNLLSHYAPTRRVTATVCGPDGRPLPGATIKFKMYNYAEYYTLATYTADAQGQASLTTGLGDILVWATDGTRYAFSKLDVRQDSTLTLTLSDQSDASDQSDILLLDIVPPVPGTAKVTPSDEAVARNARRLAYEDSLRNAYTATFPTKDNFKSYLPKDWIWNQDLFSDAQVWEIVHKSEGNYAEIFKYFETWRGQYRSGEHIYDYLKSYSDKDLRDITADVLQAHETGFDWLDRTKGTCTNALYTYDVYKKGILPARIS